MSPDCRNDCSTPVLFPRPIQNRPGLPRLEYRIGRYADFRDALLGRLNRDPVLAPWTYRGADDPGIALLEGAAILGDVLTFYQEVYANELYLPTATLPESIAGLVRLVGYRLSPGVGGQGVFAFQVSGERPVIIPKGFPLTADVTGLPDPADFETMDEITARPSLSKFALYAPFTVPAVVTGTTRLALDTAGLAGIVLEPGDRMMLVAGGYQQIAIIEKVETLFEQTEITIKGSWLGAAAGSVTGYKLGRDFRHFGYNAPPTSTVVTNGVASQVPVDFDRRVGPELFFGTFGASGASTVATAIGAIGIPTVGTAIGASGAVSTPAYDPVSGPLYFPLDSQVDDLSVGTKLLIALEVSRLVPRTSGPVFVARQVVGVRQASLTLGSLTGPTTVVQLDQLLSSAPSGITDIRSVVIHEVSGGPLTLTGPRTALPGTALSQLFFFGNGADYAALDGRELQLQRRKPAAGQAELVEQVTAAVAASAVGNPASLTLRPVTLQPVLRGFAVDEFPLVAPADAPVVVYGNLAVATQGKTESPVVLGNGDARASFQTFPLPKLPLTHLVSKSATPPEVPELVITVDDVQWTRASSLVGRGPLDQVYVVREDAGGRGYVQFGDGESGARLPSGIGNVACTYRTGTGAYGPLKPGASADAKARLPGLDGVVLPGLATGGAPSEDPDKARVSAPGKLQSLGRLVSLRDFETETLGIPGVSVATAAWAVVDSVPAVSLTVLMETGRAAELATVARLLNTYNVCRGPQRFPVVVQPGQRIYLYLDAEIALAPAYREEIVFPEVAAALARLLAGPRRSFGEREYRGRIEGVIQNVTGVRWNRVVALGILGPADDPSALTLPAAPRPLTDTLPCGAQELLALDASHLSLSAVLGPVSVCQ